MVNGCGPSVVQNIWNAPFMSKYIRYIFMTFSYNENSHSYTHMKFRFKRPKNCVFHKNGFKKASKNIVVVNRC